MTAITFRPARPHGHEAPAQNRQHGPQAAPPLFRFPSLTTTVPKEFVHRAAVAEVMLTDWKRKDDTHFNVTAQWPRGHSFFSPIGPHHDPMLAAETIRQTGSLLAHAEFGVPLGHHFLMRHLHYTVEPDHILTASTPATLDIDVTCTDIRKRGNTLTGLHYETVIHRDGQPAAHGSASYTCTTPAVYQRLRAHHTTPTRTPHPLTTPAPPHTVGRTTPTDVVLTPTTTPHQWQLRADTHHPILFDHPVDHIPGMLLLEAARQAATATPHTPTPLLPTTTTTHFHHYAELHTPTTIHTTTTHTTPTHTTLHITGHQNTTPIFTTTLTTPHTTTPHTGT
ncbi:ScbA/BarX family gamma-butyrolactone biosynthesis protein, partial [Streptomyces sp. NPDC088551]|uniref:ScbA/BarX family gamma-butyrolactone biosynthesis protein n=1 Tax=Streptomyces sp. NPDC088551 TaxID=3365863 RepID=UPI0038065187